MSLELALIELTQELRNLRPFLQNFANSPLSVPTLDETVTVLTGPTEKPATKRIKKATAEAVETLDRAPLPESLGGQDAPSDVDLARKAANLTLDLVAKKGRTPVTAILGKYGAKKTPDVPTAKLVAYIADIEAELAA